MSEALTINSQWFDTVSLVLNLILGGGLFVTFLTLRSIRKKAAAEADGTVASTESTELDNVTKAITIWRESAEKSELRAQAAEQRAQSIYDSYTKMAEEVSQLRTEVKKLTQTNVKILKILDSINHENIDQKKQEAKEVSGI